MVQTSGNLLKSAQSASAEPGLRQKCSKGAVRHLERENVLLFLPG